MSTHGAEVLQVVEGGDFDVFRRLGLHLRRKWPQVDLPGTAQLVTNPDFFDSPSFHHELFLWLQECFQMLPAEARRQYFRLVDQGPDFSRYRHSPTDRAEFVRRWTYRKLVPVRSHLDCEGRDRFERLRAEFGELAHPDFLSYSRGRTLGADKPKNRRRVTCNEL